MYEGLSITLVSNSELDIAISHAEKKYPYVSISRERLQDITNEILTGLLKHGRNGYVTILRNTLHTHRLWFTSDAREAYKLAIGKIMGARRSRHVAARKSRRSQYDIEHTTRVVISDIGPLRLDEIEARIALYNLGDDFIPMDDFLQ